MEEQKFLHREQHEDREELVSVSSTPSPMVEKAFRLLDLLSNAEDGLTFSDLARSLQMSKGGLHGLLKTLESIGAVEQEEKHRYVLGSHIYDLANSYVQRAGLRHAALPAMHRLAASTGETVCLGKVEQKGVRVVECIVEEEATLHIAVRRGQLLPLLAGSLGLCVLANWPRAKREAFLRTQPLPRFTAQSIADEAQFLTRVDETASTQIGFDRGEYLEGVNALATSIYGVGGTLVALLWIVGFASRLNETVLEPASQQLYIEAQAISQSLGART